jgi:peptidoglycan/xylan/chitin deacetylase (PgdA/CDA1 family)
VVTFDDNYVDNWYHYLPTLDSLGIRATFYISNYNRLTNDQKNKLMTIQNHGHEIAYHSVNHYNMVDYLYKYHHTMDELMQKEILPGLTLMNRDGFFPKTFAYPFGQHCGALDNALMRYFKSVRALNGTFDYSKSLVPTDKNQLLYGLGLDKSSKNSDATIDKVLQSAANNNNCAVFVAHKINSMNTTMMVTLARLKKIAARARELNLRFYTASEISLN